MSDTRGRGYRTFEKLREAGKIDSGDIVIYPWFEYDRNPSGILRRGRREIRHAVVTSSGLAACENPYDLSQGIQGHADDYRTTLYSTPWKVIKKSRIAEFQKIPLDARRNMV